MLPSILLREGWPQGPEASGELVTRGNDLRATVDDHLVTACVIDRVVSDNDATHRRRVGLFLDGNGIQRGAGGAPRAPLLVAELIVPHDYSAAVEIWTFGRIIWPFDSTA
jgi:hypothetical protein